MNKQIRLGLKGQLSYTLHNYSSIRAMLRSIKWELRYAWQRAWRGYDAADVFNFDESFRDRMIVCLERLNETRHCLFNVPDKYEDDDIPYLQRNYTGVFTDEETKHIIEYIVFCLKMSDEDAAEKKLFGKNIYDKDYDFNKTREQYLEIEELRKESQNMAFDLLKMFWDQLWD